MRFIKKVSEIIYNWLQKHWFIHTFIIAIPSIWFTIFIPLFGKHIKLQDDIGITIEGVVLSVICIAPIAIIIILNNWYSSKNSSEHLSRLEGEYEYYNSITDNVNKICEDKFQKLKRFVIDVKNGIKPVPRIVTEPNGQLQDITTAITACVAKCITRSDNTCEFRDFLVSIAYNFPLENDTWEWCNGMNENDLSLEELLDATCCSTFNYLIKTGRPYYFNNKKEDAKKEQRYHYNRQDELNEENGEPVGSIFCYNFKIKKGSIVYIDAYLSISTNKKRFSVGSEESCRNTKDNMVSLVRETFGKRISIELCLLYLEYLWNKNNPPKKTP